MWVTTNLFEAKRLLVWVPVLIICCISNVRAEEKDCFCGCRKTQLAYELKGEVKESGPESELMKFGIACSRKNDPGHTLMVSEVYPGTPAFVWGIAKGDLILKAEKNPNGFVLTIERNAKVYQANLNSLPAETARTSSNAEKSQDYSRSTDLGTRFADLWIARFYHPSDKSIRLELNAVENVIDATVRRNGGAWHIVEYYGPIDGRDQFLDLDYLLNGGVRLYAVGDLPNATRLFEEAAKFDPRCADAYFDLGAVYESQGKLSAAADNYQKALECEKATFADHPERNQYTGNARLDTRIALQDLGKVPVKYEGGLHEDATERRRHFSSACDGTCSQCRIIRNSMMDGH